MSGFLSEYGALMGQGVIDSLLMVFISTLFAYIIGLPLGILVRITQPGSILPCRPVNMVLGWIVNIGRSIPFIILIVAIMPFTSSRSDRASYSSGSAIRCATYRNIADGSR